MRFHLLMAILLRRKSLCHTIYPTCLMHCSFFKGIVIAAVALDAAKRQHYFSNLCRLFLLFSYSAPLVLKLLVLPRCMICVTEFFLRVSCQRVYRKLDFVFGCFILNPHHAQQPGNLSRKCLDDSYKFFYFLFYFLTALHITWCIAKYKVTVKISKLIRESKQ